MLPPPEVELHPRDELENIGKAIFYNIIYLNIIKLEDGKKLETYEGLPKTYN